MKSGPRLLQLEKALAQKQRPNTAKNKYKNKEINKRLLLKKKITGEILCKLPNRVFPGGAVVKNSPANAGQTGSSPGRGRPHMPQSN